MADQKVSDLPSLNGADVDPADLLYIVDSSAGSAGSKKITVGQYQLAPVSGGTANGVMYLNGSKVPTAGSSLVFDGNNLAVGTATTTNAKLFSFVNSASLPALSVRQDGAAPVQIWQALGAVEVARITSGGSLQIGTSSGSAPAVLAYKSSGTEVAILARQDGAAPIQIWQAPGTERARITSDGEFLVAKTTNADTTVGAAILSNGRVTSTLAASTNSDSSLHVYSTGAAAYRFYVGLGGTVFATSTTITAISDQRLKENIRDLDAGLSEVMALKPRKFDWKPGKGKGKKNDRGWIAQEFEQVFPDMVDTWLDPAPEGEEPYKAVNADLIPVLVKAIQEQQAIIEDLRARVAALESA